MITATVVYRNGNDRIIWHPNIGFDVLKNGKWSFRNTFEAAMMCVESRFSRFRVNHSKDGEFFITATSFAEAQEILSRYSEQGGGTFCIDPEPLPVDP